MFKNHLLIAWRNLIKNKGFSLINITGLAVGLASAILIMLWIQNEVSTDRFHKNTEHLYQVMENQRYGKGDIFTVQSTPTPLAAALKIEIPGIKYATRVTWGNTHVFHYNDKYIQEYGLYVDTDFLKMFDFPLIHGQPATALSQPQQIIISHTLAKKYFDDENPVGKIFRIDEEYNYTVTGVFKDVPANSSLQFSFLMPAKDYVSHVLNNEEQWNNNNIRTYVQLDEKVNPAAVQANLKDMLGRHEKEQRNVNMFLHAAKDWHLRGEFKNGRSVGGRISYVRLFTAVAVFIVLLACINFMNLATARATRRSKEVGVRKVLGGDRQSLIRQFLSESMLLTVVSGILALLLVIIFLPVFNDRLSQTLTLDFTNPSFVLIFLLIIVITGLIAGSYPAFLLSRFQPVKVLKGITDSIKGKAYWLRKSLVVLQFVVSVVMIIGSIVVYQQIQYISNKNLGYNKNNLVYFSSAGLPGSQYESFKQQLLAINGVQGVTRTSINFTGSNNSTSYVEWKGKITRTEVLFSIVNADHDVLHTMGIEFKEGRAFRKDFATDTSAFIINEEAARRMNLKPPVAGQEITLWDRKGPIIGVAKDFHISSIHRSIEPVILMARDWTWAFFVRMDGSKTASTLNAIEIAYKKRLPDRPFNFEFMNAEYQKMYQSEMQIGILAKWFSVLAVFISCLGLYGLVSLAASQKTKEIGIRKVLGATVTNILTLISKDFLKLVIIGGAMAFPIAWWTMDNWLQDFAYRIELQWPVFVAAVALAFLIALITIVSQAFKAANTNPVKNLRTE